MTHTSGHTHDPPAAWLAPCQAPLASPPVANAVTVTGGSLNVDVQLVFAANDKADEVVRALTKDKTATSLSQLSTRLGVKIAAVAEEKTAVAKELVMTYPPPSPPPPAPPAPPALPPPPSPPPPMPRSPLPCGSLLVSGYGCPNKYTQGGTVNQQYELLGHTADDRPYYRGVDDATKFLYYDSNCGGREPAEEWRVGWLIGHGPPSTTRRSDLLGGAANGHACSTLAHVSGADATRVPPSAVDWYIWCGSDRSSITLQLNITEASDPCGGSVSSANIDCGQCGCYDLPPGYPQEAEMRFYLHATVEFSEGCYDQGDDGVPVLASACSLARDPGCNDGGCQARGHFMWSPTHTFVPGCHAWHYGTVSSAGTAPILLGPVCTCSDAAASVGEGGSEGEATGSG